MYDSSLASACHRRYLRTFMGIAIHNYSAGDPSAGESSFDLAAALRMDAPGILGTTVQYSDLVSGSVDIGVVRRQFSESARLNYALPRASCISDGTHSRAGR